MLVVHSTWMDERRRKASIYRYHFGDNDAIADRRSTPHDVLLSHTITIPADSLFYLSTTNREPLYPGTKSNMDSKNIPQEMKAIQVVEVSLNSCLITKL